MTMIFHHPLRFYSMLSPTTEFKVILRNLNQKKRIPVRVKRLLKLDPKRKTKRKKKDYVSCCCVFYFIIIIIIIIFIVSVELKFDHQNITNIFLAQKICFSNLSSR